MRKGTRMKARFAKASFALAAALVFISAPVGATTSVTMDGVWWQGLSQGEKLVAIQGLIAGMPMGYASGVTDGWWEAMNAFKVPTSQRQTATSKFLNGNPLAGKPQFSKSFGVYVDEINVWYEVHPKRTRETPAGLLGICFADKASPPGGCDNLGSDEDK